MPFRIATLNLEEGRPAREEAILRLQFELRRARQQGHAAVRIIHGYGSSGAGGVLRYAVWNELRRLKEAGELRLFISGEDWRISNEQTWEMLKRVPSLKNQPDLGRGNRGITFAFF